jgi:hypothetical protein
MAHCKCFEAGNLTIFIAFTALDKYLENVWFSFDKVAILDCEGNVEGCVKARWKYGKIITPQNAPIALQSNGNCNWCILDVY